MAKNIQIIVENNNTKVVFVLKTESLKSIKVYKKQNKVLLKTFFVAKRRISPSKKEEQYN